MGVGLTRDYDNILSDIRVDAVDTVTVADDTATATAASVDMVNVKEMFAQITIVSGTNTITKVELLASDNATPGSGNIVVVREVNWSAGHPDAVDDQVRISCTAEEVREVSERDYSDNTALVDRTTRLDLRYVYVRVTCGDAAATWNAVYISKVLYRHKDLTAKSVIA